MGWFQQVMGWFQQVTYTSLSKGYLCRRPRELTLLLTSGCPYKRVLRRSGVDVSGVGICQVPPFKVQFYGFRFPGGVRHCHPYKV